MKSPHEVAEARAEFLDELEERIGRFAYGKDVSERYARELHDWLAERYRSDERFERVLAILVDYQAKVGQAEATEACRRLIASVREDVEGQRLRWQAVPDDKQRAWRTVFSTPAPSVDVATLWPVCGEPTLRRYFRAYEFGRGGGWEWCSSCLTYEHYQATVPAWWQGAQLLDAVPMSLLEHSPEFLERTLRLA